LPDYRRVPRRLSHTLLALLFFELDPAMCRTHSPRPSRFPPGAAAASFAGLHAELYQASLQYARRARRRGRFLGVTVLAHGMLHESSPRSRCAFRALRHAMLRSEFAGAARD